MTFLQLSLTISPRSPMQWKIFQKDTTCPISEACPSKITSSASANTSMESNRSETKDGSSAGDRTKQEDRLEDERTGDGEWSVMSRREQQSIKGSRKTNVSSEARGIGNTMDVYVGRCVPSVTCDTLNRYISEEANINVVSCVCLSGDGSNIKSFKVTVS